MQDRYGYFWTEKEVNERLEAKMCEAFTAVLQTSLKYKVDMRTAAYIVAISRVATVTRMRGMCAAVPRSATVQASYDVTRKPTRSVAPPAPLFRADLDHVVAGREAGERQVDLVVSRGGGRGDRQFAHRRAAAAEELRGHHRRLAAGTIRLEANQEPFGPAELARRDRHRVTGVEACGTRARFARAALCGVPTATSPFKSRTDTSRTSWSRICDAAS